jgi:rhamnulokinase
VRVAAVDMGATSVRVAVVDLAADAPDVEIVHRWAHGPDSRPDGSVRWRWSELVENVRSGLDRALDEGPLESIGIDGWAVDYGLLGDDRRLLSDPHSYRSGRTASWRSVAEELGDAALYRRTGVQLMPINTIFQLAAHDRDELRRARRLLMLPELVAYGLTGAEVAERTNAGTTGLLDIETGTWATDLIAAVGADPALFPPVESAGRVLGSYRDVPVCLVAAHDTACAVAASPLEDGDARAFLSAGTWFLVGVERDRPDTSDTARNANFSNELGAVGGYRFLKNVTGLWLLQQCLMLWTGSSLEELLEAAARVRDADVRLFDVQDTRFLAPELMDREVCAAAGIPEDAPRGIVVRSILESLAAGVASVVAELRRWSPIEELAVVGGGAASPLAMRLVAERSGVRVIAGAVEATALGNALLQGLALGRFRDLADARRWASSMTLTAERGR